MAVQLEFGLCFSNGQKFFATYQSLGPSEPSLINKGTLPRELNSSWHTYPLSSALCGPEKDYSYLLLYEFAIICLNKGVAPCI